MTAEQEYEMINCADDMELEGIDRTKFIEEVKRELSNVGEWEEFYNQLDNIATKYMQKILSKVCLYKKSYYIIGKKNKIR